MQKKCRRCGDKFTVRTYEDYCPECEKVMIPPGEGISKKITCESCGQTFTHTKEKLVGRWPKYCPECLPKYSNVPKKQKEKDIVVTLANRVPKKKEVDVTLDNMVAKREEVDVTLANMIAKTLEEPEVKVVEEDAINHPSHYTRGKIEVIDFIEDQQLPYHLGNVIKYIARAGYKGDKLEDLKKARWYLDRYINEVMQHE